MEDPNLSKTQIIFSILFSFVVIYFLYQWSNPTPQPPKTAAQSRQDKIDDQFSSWDGSHKNLTKLIKENMHNPKSFEHVRTFRYDKSEYGKGDLIHVRTIYRGTNTFNAVVTNTIEADFDFDGNLITVTHQD